MLLRTKEYVGDNPYNNEVYIDYDRRTVRFKPLRNHGFFGLYFFFLGHIFVAWLAFCLLSAGVIGLIGILLYIFLGVSLDLFLFYYALLIVATLVFGVLLSLKFFDRGWRERVYPKFNYWLVHLLQHENFVVVNRRAVVNRRFLLPVFENIGLDYEVSGDFAKYLRRIEVLSLFKTDRGDWLCCFTFRKTPVSGELRIRYI